MSPDSYTSEISQSGFSIVIRFRDLQSSNANRSIRLTLVGSVISVRVSLFSNALMLIYCTPSGTVTLPAAFAPLMTLLQATTIGFSACFAFIHGVSSKAARPMRTAVSGRLTFASFSQPLNAHCPIAVTLFGIVTEVRSFATEFWPAENANAAIVFTPSGITASPDAVTPSSRMPFTITSGFSARFALSHAVSPNAGSPNSVTVAGITTSLSAVQPENTRLPIVSQPSGIVTDFSAVQFANADS